MLVFKDHVRLGRRKGGGKEGLLMITQGVQCKVQSIKMNKEPVSIFVGVEFRKYLA